MFNRCFTSFESSLSTENDSAKFIFDKFKELKNKSLFCIAGFSFMLSLMSNILVKLINNLLPSSSPGQLGIRAKILKEMPEIFIPILHQLFNSYLESKRIPEDWKISLVTTLYKSKNGKTYINNYRAISVLSAIAKIFEKLIAK